MFLSFKHYSHSFLKENTGYQGKMLVRIAKKEDSDQTSSSKQSNLGMSCCSRPLWQATSVRKFRKFTGRLFINHCHVENFNVLTPQFYPVDMQNSSCRCKMISFYSKFPIYYYRVHRGWSNMLSRSLLKL